MQSSLQTVAESPATSKALHGLPTPANDVPPSGFTAVNGDGHGQASFRPSSSGPPSLSLSTKEQHTGAGPTPITTAYGTYSWRPDERQAPQDDQIQERAPSTSKRKRDEPASDSEQLGHTAEGNSPKRRMISSSSGSTRNPHRNSQTRPYSNDERQADGEPATTGPYVREPSPVARWNRGEPPPAPRPEVEAGLAASLQQTLGDDDEQQQSTQPPAPDASTSPRLGSHERQESQAQSPDDAQQGDSSDPKKRKRNFSNRTKTGCHTCRSRKKKCDEGKPVCENCKRGHFECGGYGPKPPGGTKISAARQVVPLQAKQSYEHPPQIVHPPYEHRHYHTASSPPPFWHPARPDAYPPPHHRYELPNAMEHRPPSARNTWASRPTWSEPATWPGPESTPYLSERLPPVIDRPVHVPPPHGMTAETQRHWPPDHWRNTGGQSQYQQQPPPHAPQSIASSSLDSSSSRHPGSRHSGVAHLSSAWSASEDHSSVRTKMLTGEFYQHYMDTSLLTERKSCQQAVECYNKALDEHKERHFQSILRPDIRITMPFSNWSGPIGSCGSRTIVETPFSCEYGYNIQLGDEVVIGANCRMQDACQIWIGNRTIIGENVKFYCMTASVDKAKREGNRGNFFAGAITVHDDCFIGADVTILPFRTIGRGAVVGAGSVVTRVSLQSSTTDVVCS